MIETSTTTVPSSSNASTSTASPTTASTSCCSAAAAAIILKTSNRSQHEALLGTSPEQYETFLDETLLSASASSSTRQQINSVATDNSGKNLLVEQFQHYQASDDEYSLSVQLFLDSPVVVHGSHSSCSANDLVVLSAVLNTLQELKRAHVDMLLIKASSPQQVLNYWSDVELLVENGLVKQVGVCDFSVDELQSFMSSSQIKIQPQIVQVNLASYESLESLNDMTQFCSSRDIKVLTGSRGSLNDFRKAGSRVLGSSQVSLDYVVRYSLVSKPTSVVKDMGFIVKVDGNEKCQCISGQCL